MKIVIVEDEPKTREGIKNILHRSPDFEIVGVAINGLEGMGLIYEKKPQVVITDIKMPVMDGLEMTKKIREKGINTEIILLTGYSDFEYARKALELGVLEYVLKPVDSHILIKTLMKVGAKIVKRKSEKMSPELALYQLLLSDNKILFSYLENELEIEEETESTMFLIYPTETSDEILRSLRDLLRIKLDILCMSNYYVLQIPQCSGILLLIVDTKRNHYLKQIFEKKINNDLNEITKCIVSMVTMLGIRDIKNKVKELRGILPYCFHAIKNEVIDAQMAKNSKFEEIDYPEDLAKTMEKAIKTRDNKLISKIEADYMTGIIRSKGEPNCIRNFTIRFVATIQRLEDRLSGNEETIEILGYIINRIATCISVEQVEYLFHKTISIATSAQQENITTENELVLTAISFIRGNYGMDISLTDVASFCNVTPEYFSKLFSNEIGVGFSVFLQRYRVSEAKRQLSMSNAKVADVAENVGFHDQKYFAKVFKKYIGITPAEYIKEE